MTSTLLTLILLLTPAHAQEPLPLPLPDENPAFEEVQDVASWDEEEEFMFEEPPMDDFTFEQQGFEPEFEQPTEEYFEEPLNAAPVFYRAGQQVDLVPEKQMQAPETLPDPEPIVEEPELVDEPIELEPEKELQPSAPVQKSGGMMKTYLLVGFCLFFALGTLFVLGKMKKKPVTVETPPAPQTPSQGI